MTPPATGRPEDRARSNIDRLLTAAGVVEAKKTGIPANRHQRTETERFHSFSYDDLIKRDKTNLDIFWLRDDSLGDASDLPDPAVLAAEIVEDLQAALDQFAQIAVDLASSRNQSSK